MTETERMLRELLYKTRWYVRDYASAFNLSPTGREEAEALYQRIVAESKVTTPEVRVVSEGD